MKYQKTMMKIFENLLLDRRSKTIEKLIQETKTGRNSAFAAVKWLEDKVKQLDQIAQQRTGARPSKKAIRKKR